MTFEYKNRSIHSNDDLPRRNLLIPDLKERLLFYNVFWNFYG